MHKYLSEISFLISTDKYKIPFLITLFLVISLLEIVGLGLIAPYIEILIGQDGIYLKYLENLLSIFHLELSKTSLILLISFLIIIVFFIKAIGNIYINWLVLKFVHTKEISLRYELIKSYYNYDYEKMIANKSSDSIENIVSLVPAFIFTTLQPFLKVISDGIICVMILIFLFFSLGKATILLTLALIMIIFIYDKIFSRRMVSYGKNSSQSQKAIIKGTQETLNGFKEIKILDKEKFFTNTVLEGASEYAKNKVKISLIVSSPGFIFEFLIISSMILFVIFYVTFHGTNILSIMPLLGILALAIIRMVPKTGVISSNITKIKSGRYATEKIYLVLNKNNEKLIKDINVNNIEPFKNLSLERIKYSYPNTNIDVINNLSFSINKGQQIGIVGSSGSGKTTFLDIILGHLTPKNGKIIFNKKELNNENYQLLLSQASYIPQEIFLIDDTLKKNITLEDNKDLDLIKLNNAINLANLNELVEKLENGIDTLIGENGSVLSGGQKQRIAIARSFYHNKDLIIFDEATSALDSITEKKIMKEISNLGHHKTVIIITHRKESLKHCDNIYEIDKGQLKQIEV